MHRRQLSRNNSFFSSIKQNTLEQQPILPLVDSTAEAQEPPSKAAKAGEVTLRQPIDDQAEAFGREFTTSIIEEEKALGMQLTRPADIDACMFRDYEKFRDKPDSLWNCHSGQLEKLKRVGLESPHTIFRFFLDLRQRSTFDKECLKVALSPENRNPALQQYFERAVKPIRDLARSAETILSNQTPLLPELAAIVRQYLEGARSKDIPSSYSDGDINDQQTTASPSSVRLLK